MSTTADSAYSRGPQRSIIALSSFRVLPMIYMAPHWKATIRGELSPPNPTPSSPVGGAVG